MLCSRTWSRQSPPADGGGGGGGNAGTELPISTLYLLQGPLAVTFKRQGGLASRELAVGRRHRRDQALQDCPGWDGLAGLGAEREVPGTDCG